MHPHPDDRGPPRPAQVLIVDDHELVRRGLSEMIEREADLVPCGEAAGEPAAMALVRRLHPEAALVDITLRDGNGLNLVKQIHATHPRTRVVVVTMHDEDVYAERAIRAGAMGFVRKDEPAVTIVAALRTVLSGRIHVSERLTDRLLQRIREREDGAQEPADRLSDREIEVLDLLGAGLSTRAVAERLHLAPKTIYGYRETLRDKLGLRSASEVVRHAVARNLLGD